MTLAVKIALKLHYKQINLEKATILLSSKGLRLKGVKGEIR